MTKRHHAFSLIELLVVMGLISVMLSLLLPVVSKARAAARSTACLSNVRQIGMAWQLYTAENKGSLLANVWNTPATPNVAWNAYWLGAVERYNVKGEALLCPSATEASSKKQGYGSVNLAWNGELGSNGSVVKLNASTFRVSSYGFNNYLTTDSQQSRLFAIKNLTEVPAFMDCAWADTRPDEQTEAFPVDPPPDLSANVTAGSPDHWRFLMSRHGRGINVCFADGSARWVALEDCYQMKWNRNWRGYRLSLPGN